MKKEIVIFGSSETAELAKYYFEHDSPYQVVAFTVDDGFVKENSFEGKPLLGFSEATQKYPPGKVDMHVALSYGKLNQLRQEKYLQAKTAGYHLASYRHSHSSISPDFSQGENCFILENQTIQPKVIFGENVMVWSGNHFGHGCSIGSHAYISSHVVVCGHSRIGERSFMGVNSAVKDFIQIAEDCFVGMGASVTCNLASGSVALGPTAETYPADDRRSRALKKAYFKI